MTACAHCGACVGTQASAPSGRICTVQFIGSMQACGAKGSSYTPSTFFVAEPRAAWAWPSLRTTFPGFAAFSMKCLRSDSLDIPWDEGPNAGESSESLRKHFIENAAKPGKVVRNDGDADAALGSATKKVEAVYGLPFAPHACMEPINCTVHIRPDGAEDWVPTQ